MAPYVAPHRDHVAADEDAGAAGAGATGAGAGGGPTTYSLFAVVLHAGGTERGHYTAHARHMRGRQWWCFDDASCVPVPEADVMSPRVASLAYLLFYARDSVVAAGAPSATFSLDLLDAPGVVPPSLGDQRAAARLAACNDIGQAAYLESAVAAELIETLLALPSGRGRAAVDVLGTRLRVADAQWETAEDFLSVAASQLYRGDVEQAGARVLKDYRNGALGAVALEDAGEWAERFRSRGGRRQRM